MSDFEHHAHAQPRHNSVAGLDNDDDDDDDDYQTRVTRMIEARRLTPSWVEITLFNVQKTMPDT